MMDAFRTGQTNVGFWKQLQAPLFQCNIELKKNFGLRHNLTRAVLEKLFQNYCLLNYSSQHFKTQAFNYKDRPYWQYCMINMKTKTDKLDFLKNKVFMYNNKIWDKFYPPNFSCCPGYVRALDMKELNSLGLTVYEIDEFEHPFSNWAFNPGKTDINQFIKKMIKKSIRLKKES